MDNQTQPAQSAPAAPVAPVVPPPAAPVPPASAVPPATTPPVSPTPSAVPPKKSSKMGLFLVLLIIVILAVAGWFAYSYFMNKSTAMYQNAYKAKKVATQSVPTPTLGAVTSGDTQLDQQSTAIDDSMKKLDDDVKGVDTVLNDKSEDLN